jgi:hypothetical protein
LRRASKIFTITFTFFIVATTSLLGYAQAQSSASISVYADRIPGTAMVVGQGFGPSESVTINLYDGTGGLISPLATITADGEGYFNAAISVRTLDLIGTYVVTASSATASASASYELQPIPSDTVAPLPTTSGLVQFPAVTSSPNNSNLINVTGTGFSASLPVLIRILRSNGSIAYSVNQNITTDAQGTFSTIVNIPTTINGTFILQAKTPLEDAKTQIKVPNSQTQESTSPTAAPEPTGTANSTENGNDNPTQNANTLQYVSIALSIVAIVISLFAVTKKNRQPAATPA